jgi:hypothetical protein
MKCWKLVIACCMVTFAFTLSAEAAAPAPAKQAKQTQIKQAKNEAPAPTMPTEVRIYAPDGVPEKVKQELANVSKTLVGNAAKTIMPNIRSKAVAPGGSGGYIASYTEVDISDVQAEILPSAESGKYVGAIRYREHQYECPGKSQADALRAECQLVKSRRMNELVRYEKGKWHY